MVWSSADSYSHDLFLIDFADDILNQIIQKEFKTTEFDEILHFPINEIEYVCGPCCDLGIPCPFTIRLLKIKQSQPANDGSDGIELILIWWQKFVKIDFSWMACINTSKSISAIDKKEKRDFSGSFSW